MIRIGLTLWFALLTLVSPAVCCCSLGRIISGQAAATTTKAAPAPKSCCSHKADKNAPQSPSAPKPCPCKDKADKCAATPTAAPTSDESRSQVYSQWFQTFNAIRAESPLLVDTDEPIAGTIALPFDDIDDLLRAMHFLRC